MKIFGQESRRQIATLLSFTLFFAPVLTIASVPEINHKPGLSVATSLLAASLFKNHTRAPRLPQTTYQQPLPSPQTSIVPPLPRDISIMGDISVGGSLNVSQNGINLFEDPVNGSDSVTLKAAADMPASYTLRFPSAAPTGDLYLATDANGNMLWASGSGGVGNIVDGGNTFGHDIAIGSNDNFGMAFKTNNTNRIMLANNGAITVNSLAGASDRYVTASSSGLVTATMPTGVKDIVQVINDVPVVDGKYYNTLKDAVDWANANATEITVISVAGGTHVVNDTVEITNPLIRGISGVSSGGTILAPGSSLAGSPLLILSQNAGGDVFTVQDLSINGFTEPAYISTPGSVGIRITGISNFGLVNVLAQGCFRNIEIDGENNISLLQTIVLNSCVLLGAGDCGLLLDNGAFASANNLIVYGAGNNLVRAQCTNAASPMTELTVVASWLTDVVPGTADGIVARDNSYVLLQASRVYDVQNAVVAEGVGQIKSMGNVRVKGEITHYKQVDGSAKIQVVGDFVDGAQNSQFGIVNPNNVYFDILDIATNLRKSGRFVDESYLIDAVLTGHENKDPVYQYISNWFGFKGDGIELSEEVLSGAAGVTGISTWNSSAYNSSLIRGLQAHTKDAGLVLATYASDGDPSTPDYSKARSWRLIKRANDHAFTMIHFNGAAYSMPLILTATGNLGLGASAPVSRLELGSGQISVPVGDAVFPSYSFTGDLNTGVFSPASNSVALSTDGLARLIVDASGAVTVSGLGSGIVHSSVAGLLTSSPLVNSDIADGSITNAKLATPVMSSNTPNSIVMRDAAGNFSAATITASLNGNATTATSAGSFSGVLSGQVTGPQNLTVVAAVDGKTAAEVGSAVTDVQNATPNATLSTLVKRDASGNFSAGTVTATLLGNVTGNVSGSATNFTGNLLGDVTGTQGATVVSTVSGVSAANVASGANAANAATNANTASTIVKRDGSGNFSAGTITASLTGAASLNVLKAGDTMTGPLVMSNQQPIRLSQFGGSNYAALRAPATLGSSYTLTMPATVGANNQVLSSDGLGGLLWQDIGTTGGYFLNGGNSFAGNASLGTNDPFSLALKTGGINRLTFAASGAINIPAFAGSGERYVSTDTAGTLASVLPVGTKNVLYVVKDHPVVSGKYYATIQDAVDWANANAVEPTTIWIESGYFSVTSTIDITNPMVRAIRGESVGGSIVVPDVALVGLPVFHLSANYGFDTFSIQDLSINGSGTPGYMTTPGGVGLLVTGVANFGLLNILTQGCYRGFEIDGDPAFPGGQISVLTSCYALLSGDCGVLVDNGAFVTATELVAAWSGSQEIRVQRTNGAAPMTELTIVASWLTDDVAGTGDGLLAKDVSKVLLESSRVYDVQNALVAEGNALVASLGNLRLAGVVTNYKQIDGTAVIQASGDLVEDAAVSKFLITDADNVYFDIIDRAGNVRKIGNMTNDNVSVFSILTGSGAGDPWYGYQKDWFGYRGELFEMPEAAMVGSSGNAGRALCTVNNDALLVSFVRGLQAHNKEAGLLLGTYASDGDPATPDYSLSRAWQLYKNPFGNGTLSFASFNGAIWQSPFSLTMDGNLGLSSELPSTRLEVGSGQVSAPAGNAVAPTYTFLSNLNTGLYSPGLGAVALSSNGLASLIAQASGVITIPNLAPTAGVVHNDASGNLSSSLIVNTDVSASAAIADAKLATIATAGKVLNSATTATSTNTASAIVARDGSGNFSANMITANITGNVTGNVSGTAAGFTGSLSGDVTGTQGATSVAFVNGQSAVNVSTATIAANAATPSNTASTIVKRDASGNFNASTISAVSFSGPLTGNVTGNVSGSAASFTGSLLGDVTGTQGATVVSTVNGVSAANVATGATAANAATSLNTASTIVKRDGSGNFIAGTITAALTGAASDNVLKAGDTMTGNLTMSNQKQVRLAETNPGINYVALQAPSSLGSPYTLTLPISAGTTGYVLATDGSGVLSWQPAGSAAGYFINGGNNFGGVGPAVLGTTAASGYGLNLISNGNQAISLSNTGTVLIPSLVGTGDRVVQADATGTLSATLPTGTKNVIYVTKDIPTVTGKYYPTLNAAVAWANANAVEQTAIVMAPGSHIITATVTVSNPLVTAIIGQGAAATRLVVDGAVVGSPVLTLSQTTDAFSLQDIVIDATGVPAFMTTPGSIGIYIPGTAYYDLNNVLIQGCYQGVFVDGLTALATETVALINCFILLSGDCGLLIDNGGYVFGNNVTISYSGNQDVRAQSTNVGAQRTQISLTASWISGAGAGDGVLVKDDAYALISSSRVYDIQNAFVAAGSGEMNTVGNTRVEGIATHYKQIDGTAQLEALGDIVTGATPDKFSVADSDNVYFDGFDTVAEEHYFGKMTNTTYELSKILTGNGVNDPVTRYVKNWFGYTGSGVELSEAALGGLAGVQTVVTYNSDAFTASFIRGPNAHSYTAGVTLASYASDGDPVTPDWSLARSWRIEKRPTDHAFQLKRWNGSNYLTPLMMTSDGNLGLDSTGVLTNPVSQLELGSGQIAVPAGNAPAPSYSFTGDLNTGIYSPGADSVAFSTNGLSRLSIAADGGVSIPTFTLAGIVHNSAAGLLSSSLIVNGDITNGTITDAKLATIATPLKVSNSATTATSVNTADAIVARDGSGNFSAGTITANLTGNVTGSVTGAASLNVLKAGDAMTGSLSLSGGSTNLTVGGTSYLQAAQTAGLLSVNNGVYFLNGVPCLPQNVLQVTKGTISGPNQFNSVKTAIDSIVGNTATNPFVVLVGPGLFTESDTITLKSYVAVVGDSGYTSLLYLSDPSKNVITGVHDAILKDLWIQGATNVGSAGVVYHGGTGGLSINGCVFANNNILINIDDATAPYTFVTIVGSMILPFFSYATGIKVRGSTNSVTVQVNGFNWAAVTGLTVDSILDISGTRVVFAAQGMDLGALGTGTVTGIGCTIANGATVDLLASAFHGFTNGINVANSGTGPKITLASLVCRNNATKDIIISHPSTTGTLNGIFDRSKATIDPSAALSVFFTDPVNAGTVTVGPMFLGATYPQVTNVSNQIEHGANLGLLSGGVFSEAVGALQVDIALGNGYAMVGTAPNDYLKYVEWVAQTVTLTANADNFLFIDNAGVAHASTSEPNNTTTILLGKMRANATGEVFCERMAESMQHTASELDYSWRAALGPVYASGSLVSKNGTVQLNVTQGRYFYGTIEYNPSAGTAVSWKAFYTSGASGNYVAVAQSSVDYAQYNYYNSGSGVWSLAAIPGDKFARHAFYVVNDGDDQYYLLVYGQTVYNTLLDAQNGSIPPAPATWTGNIALIASLIVKNDLTTPANYISEIRDERPRLGFKASGVSVISVHGDLQGLSADDHLQYLRTDGTRVLTGNLQMGANNIVTSGLVDGVDVSAHAARHQPGGLDALLVSTPVTIGTANAEGILTTLARSDHVHAHGAQTDGTLHAVATPNPGGVAGFMSAADKTILDSVNPALYVLKAGDSMTGTLNITAGLNNALVINTNKFVVDSTTGNTTVGGILGVSGATTLSHLASGSAGIVHATTAGLLSKSLIVDADVDAAAAIADTKLATIATALKVSNSATTAASANTASSIVARDASGVFNTSSIVLENQGQLRLQDSTTNLVQLRAPAAVSTYTLTFPGALGALDQILKTDASGNLDWVNGVFNGGNTVAAAMQIGSINNYGLNLQTNSVDRLEISNAGVVKVANLAAANGVVCPDATGILSSRLVVNTDVSTLSPLADNKLATISTAGKVANSATTATNLNNPSTIVLRDASGNFSAGVITASLTGNVTGNVTGSATSFSGSLVGDVTGIQSATVVENVGGVLAANVASGANAANAATHLNTASAIVKRDGSGNFSAGTITASLTGHASLDLPLTGGILSGSLTMNNVPIVLQNGLGNTVTVQVPAAGLSNYALTLPTTSGTSGYVLTTDGANPATLTWQPTGAGAGYFVNGGNAFGGGTTTLGTIDSNNLNIVTGAAGPNTRLSISSSGTIAIPAFTTAGVVHNAVTTGNLSSSLIVDGDITVGTIANNKLVTLTAGGLVDNSATTATHLNTASAIVARDASGNFNASTILLENQGQLQLQQPTAGGSDTVNLRAPATLTGGSYTLTLPLATGATGTALVTDGSGNLSWSNFAPTGSYFTQGGNAFGATAVLGTTDPRGLNFVTGGASNNRLTISSTGTIAIPAFTAAGIVHNAVTTGNLSSSLIVDADVDPAAAIVDTKLATISTAGKVLNSATTATNVNTPSAIVARDASGIFDIGSIFFENQGQVRLGEAVGNGLNYVALRASSIMGANYTLTLPAAVGATNQILVATDGVGTLGWITSLPGYVLIGGNTAGSLMSIGTIDNYGLTLKTNNTDRVQISNAGTVTIPNLSTVGIVHNATGGLLSTSLIVNTDVDPTAAIVDTKLATISTAGKVANSATTAISAPANANTIVLRDGSGNFTANVVTASLTGNVTGNVTGSASLNILKAGDTMTGPLTMNSQQQIRLRDIANSNSAALEAPDALGASYVLKLPTSAGTAGYALTTDGNNPALLSWSPIGSAAGYFINGGNSFLATASLGTNDLNNLLLKTNNTARMIIDSTGKFGIGQATVDANYTLAAMGDLLVQGGSGTSTLIGLTKGTTQWALAAETAGSTNTFSVRNVAGGLPGTTRMIIDNTGVTNKTTFYTGMQVSTLNAVGVVHTDAAGNFSTSTITNADIDAAAGIVDTKLATIATAGKVSNSATTATSANTASTIVARDASGNFSAGTITASLTGHASLDLPLTGGTLTGTLAINAGAGNALVVNTNKFIVDNTTGDTTIAGTVGVTGATTLSSLGLGVVHSSGAGLLSSSLIVNADVDPAAAIVDTKLATIATAGKVSNSATTATDANTASTIVARDASGNFSAGMITASLTGHASLDLPLTGGALSGSLTMSNVPLILANGSANTISLAAPATLTNYTFTFPTTAGTNGYALTTNGSGTLSWSNFAPAGSYFVNGGNSFIGTASLGTNDGYDLNFKTNNVTRMQILSAGTIAIPAFTTAGIVHNADTTGNLSSSLIVNADVSAAASIVDTKLATISTAGKVSNSATTATSANTVDAIVARDASGNFSAGTISATFSGNLTGSVTGAASLNVLKAGDTMTGNLIMSNQQQVRLSELTINGNNYIALRAPASVTADTVLTLPDGAGTNGYALTTNGSGTLSWTNLAPAGNYFTQGGNAFTATAVLGTTDAFGLNLVTGGAGNNRLTISSAGTIAIPAFATAGIVHNAVTTGNLSSSLIVDADVAAAAGIVDTKLATIATAGKVSNSATTATSANTASAIVARDASGNMNAGIVTCETSLKLKDTGSANTITLQAPTLASAYTLTLPTDVGTNGYVLTTNGASPATLSWQPSGSATNAFVNGGNSFSATATLGTNDTNDLLFKTNGTDRMIIDSTGKVAIGQSTVDPNFGIRLNSDTLLAGAGLSGNTYLGMQQGTSIWGLEVDTTGGINTFTIRDATTSGLLGNVRVEIDTAGNTTTSTNYKMAAYRATTNQVIGAATGIIVFNTELFDPGADYNNATGRYTAPYTGYYLVAPNVTVLSTTTAGNRTMALYRGGVAIPGYAVRNYFVVGAGRNFLMSATWLLYMAAGDIIDVRLTGLHSADAVVFDYSSLQIHYMSFTPV